jgi:hypothetical protein
MPLRNLKSWFKGAATTGSLGSTAGAGEAAREELLQAQAITQSSSGKLSVDVDLLTQTKKFRDDLEVLQKIEENEMAYRKLRALAG